MEHDVKATLLLIVHASCCLHAPIRDGGRQTASDFVRLNKLQQYFSSSALLPSFEPVPLWLFHTGSLEILLSYLEFVRAGKHNDFTNIYLKLQPFGPKCFWCFSCLKIHRTVSGSRPSSLVGQNAAKEHNQGKNCFSSKGSRRGYERKLPHWEGLCKEWRSLAMGSSFTIKCWSNAFEQFRLFIVHWI